MATEKSPIFVRWLTLRRLLNYWSARGVKMPSSTSSEQHTEFFGWFFVGTWEVFSVVTFCPKKRVNPTPQRITLAFLTQVSFGPRKSIWNHKFTSVWKQIFWCYDPLQIPFAQCAIRNDSCVDCYLAHLVNDYMHGSDVRVNNSFFWVPGTFELWRFFVNLWSDWWFRNPAHQLSLYV